MDWQASSKGNLDSAIMHRFRDHIGRGSWLALVALTINLGLSFGHIHAIHGKELGHLSAAQMATSASPDDRQAPDNDDGDQADLLCSICIATAAMGHALAFAPPALPLAFAEPPIDLAIEPVLAVPQPPQAAFHSRGPPIS